MEPLLLGLAAPSIASAVGSVGRAVTPVAKLAMTPFAAILQQQSQAPTAPTASKAEVHTPTLSDIRDSAKSLQSELVNRIQNAIEDSGVKVNFPVRLQISEFDGRLEVEDIASPDREILEASLNSDPSLTDDFRELSALKKILGIAEDEAGFTEAFAISPHQAITDYLIPGAERHEALLHLSESGDELQLAFE